jgi:septal ring factor EnvC (AmiA/AmiB activator)
VRRQDPRPRSRGDRTAFYGDRPYAHLRAEFEQRLQALQQNSEQPDRRDAQITRLRNEIDTLKERLTQSASKISDLTGFRARALARLAAQHDEITRLRHLASQAAAIRRLPPPKPARER